VAQHRRGSDHLAVAVVSFATVPEGDGWAVVDELSGHPVTRPRDTHQSAAATANILNAAARQGGRALARALGCVDDGESDYLAVRF
jgi:hypothetical protein